MRKKEKLKVNNRDIGEILILTADQHDIREIKVKEALLSDKYDNSINSCFNLFRSQSSYCESHSAHVLCF